MPVHAHQSKFIGKIVLPNARIRSSCASDRRGEVFTAV